MRRYLNPRAWLATLMFIAMSMAVAAAGYWPFGRAFYSEFNSLLPLGVINLKVWNGHIGNEEPRGAHFLWHILKWIIFVCVAFILVLIIYDNKYFLLGYQGLALIAVLVVLDIRRHVRKLERWAKHASTLCSVMCAAIILATALFAAIVRPMTTWGAERLLADAEYENPAYVTYFDKYYTSFYYMSAEIPKDTGVFEKLGAYLLCAERGGEEYGVLVSVEQGEIIRVAPLAEDSFLADIIEDMTEQG